MHFKHDANSNRTMRVESGITYTQTFRHALSGSQCDAFDTQNRLTSVAVGPSGQTTQFLYDPDGNPSTRPGGARVIPKRSGVGGRVWALRGEVVRRTHTMIHSLEQNARLGRQGQ
jgi:YD repeat-containing protein